MKVFDNYTLQFEVKILVTAAFCIFPEMEIICAVSKYMRAYFDTIEQDVFNAVFLADKIPYTEP